MNYLGSKSRHVKSLLPIILRERQERQLYIEPFVGGANTFAKVAEPKLGSDIDEDLIVLWQAVSRGWLPPETLSEIEYNRLKEAPSSALKGYAAYALSFGGKKFGGWSRGNASNGRPRLYDKEAYRSAIKQFPLLKGACFLRCSYEQLEVPKGSLVYCDPPYAAVTGYASSFDSKKFWDWCFALDKSIRLFVSEYTAPSGFEVVWEKEVPVSVNATRKTSPVRIERLFTRWTG